MSKLKKDITGPITITLSEKDRNVIMFALRSDFETVVDSLQSGDPSFVGDDEYLLEVMSKIGSNANEQSK